MAPFVRDNDEEPVYITYASKEYFGPAVGPVPVVYAIYESNSTT
jgi:hypothetical protein